ncbi:DeoR/GlpR family transcriptional regulator [Kineosporia sp. J2-2]|uniref:DeoR/GlpR family transcriptional regulator n=1 Tax=Kineosporia corallincola TaxID=2835133 RepID=A0ABS5TGP6_9ACTN|nr:substrate-binding domain-containing protein [Kineosporia corallincola]MBT0770033.1 DeoR/GlpR family transcriptional regulator [Kineosporia corallincola]
MIAAERHEAVLRELRLRGTLAVSEFAGRLGVSPITLRRDLQILQDAGELTRVHGGAVPVRRPATGEPLPQNTYGRRSRQQLAAAFGLAPAGATPSVVATIGMIVPTRHYYYAGTIEGAQTAARLAGVRLVLAVSDYDETEEIRLFRRMLRLGTDGVLITPSRSGLEHSPVRDLVESSPVPVTVLERVWDFPARSRVVDSVRSDHRVGAELAVRHLAGLGHRRAGLWTFGNPHVGEIRSGFETEARRAGFELHRPVFGEGHRDWNTTDLTRNVRRYLQEALAAGVTALLVHPDELALRMSQVALEAGVRVPGDLSIVAYDDETAGLGEHPLTAIAPPKQEIGFAAVDACLRAIAHHGPTTPDFPAQRIRLLPTLRVRASTTPPSTLSTGPRSVTRASTDRLSRGLRPAPAHRPGPSSAPAPAAPPRPGPHR